MSFTPEPRREDPLAVALAAGSRRELLRALGAPRPELALPDVMRLSARLRALAADGGGADGPPRPLRLAVLRTYATELLRPYLELEALLAGHALELFEGPYGVVRQEATPGSELARFGPELTLVLARVEDLAPGWGEPLGLLAAEERERRVAEAVGACFDTLSALRATVAGPIVFAPLPRSGPLELGLADAMAEGSEGEARHRFARALARRLATELADVLLHDQEEVAARVGRRSFFDARLWHTSRFPFSRLGASEAVRALYGYAVRRTRPQVKCIALDADDTLWGGIVGEEGLEGIALGPDWPGSAYVAFQRRLLDFRRRGVLLALCSKNDEAAVLEVLERHPHQVLRREHFAALRVNWEPKPANLAALAGELSLGLDSFLFLDDSPHECDAVAQACPEVLVLRAPSDPLRLVRVLDEEPRLEATTLTDEDRRRAEMYAAERGRRELAGSAASVEDWLRSLEMVMTVRVDDEAGLERAAQLVGKTNQFNLTTRRHDRATIEERFLRPERAFVATFSLADVFGDSGTVGVALVAPVAGEPETAEVDTFLMSCRVIGRGAEKAFLESVLGTCRARGFARVRASYAPTPRNGLVAGFWPGSGFEERGEGRYELDLGSRGAPERPPIEVREEPSQAASRPPRP